jgi:nitrate/nitrite-specific signal transduction histidine kinase
MTQEAGMPDRPAPTHAHLQRRIDALAADNDALGALLVSADIPIILLDAELRITRFTPASARVLNIRASDAGRPIADIASKVIDVDLARHARAVLDEERTVEKALVGLEGRRYLFRALPHRVLNRTRGVVMAFVDLGGLNVGDESLRAASHQVATDLRRLARLYALTDRLPERGELRARLEQVVQATVDITAASIATIQLREGEAGLTLVAHIGVDAWFTEFFSRLDAWATFAADVSDRQVRVVVSDIATRHPLVETDHQQILTAIGVRALQSTALFDRSGRCIGALTTYYRRPQRFDESECRWFDLLARHAVDVIERRRTEDLWTSAANQLQRRVTERTTWLVLMQDLARAINAAASGEDALRLVIHRICETGYWQLAYVYLVDPDDPQMIVPTMSWAARERLRPVHLASAQRRDGSGPSLPGRAYAGASPVWVNGESALRAALPDRADAAARAGITSAVAIPIKAGADVVAVIELFSEHDDAPHRALADVMNDVGLQIARVIQGERGTNMALDFVRREQQALLQTLHDSLGQTLTGVGMLSAGLRQRLSTIDAGMATTAAQIAEQAQLALEQLRQISRGLVPLEVAPDDLMAAIRDLASTTENLHAIRVTVEGGLHRSLGDTRVATELFRITQEAVTNALKHAHATTIRIELRERAGLVTLVVIDDGIGIPTDVHSTGFGLRIMQERAGSIGALLSTAPSPIGGTVVTCLLRPAMASGPEVHQ